VHKRLKKEPISELRSWDQCYTCHQTQVNATRLNLKKAGWKLELDLSVPIPQNGRLS